MEHNSIEINSTAEGWGTIVKVNGQIVRECRAVRFESRADSAPVLTLEVYALGGVVIDGSSTVEIVDVTPDELRRPQE